MQQHAQRPRPGVDLRVGERRLVADGVGVEESPALDDVKGVAVEVA